MKILLLLLISIIYISSYKFTNLDLNVAKERLYKLDFTKKYNNIIDNMIFE